MREKGMPVWVALFLLLMALQCNESGIVFKRRMRN